MLVIAQATLAAAIRVEVLPRAEAAIDSAVNGSTVIPTADTFF